MFSKFKLDKQLAEYWFLSLIRWGFAFPFVSSLINEERKQVRMEALGANDLVSDRPSFGPT
jgi:hypothetical protein